MRRPAAEAVLSYLSRAGFRSAVLVVHFRATLAQGETLTLAAKIKDATSAVGAGAADYGNALAAAVVVTGGAALALK
jgi:hypothetical protein